MTETRSWRFGPFHLDVGAARLWHGSEAVRLTAKAWSVLHYLVAHAGQMVSKENLYAAVWDAATLSDAALAACIRELRQALGDTAQTSQYVETVRGRDTARAVQYLQYAGEQAAQRSAHQEALRHLTQGLTLLATLPDTPARVQQELDLRLALGPALMSAKGLAAPEVEQTYVRAHVLCHQLGETSQLVPTLRGLCEFYRNRGALPMARELGTQLFRIAQRAATPTLRLEAHEALGATVFFLGEYATAWTHYAQGIARIDPAAQRTLALHHGLALLAEALTVLEERGQGDLLAEVYRLQGEFRVRQAVSDPAQAEACFQQALNIARQQQAKSWELRAALSLARLWQQQGKHAEARELLAPIYGWFTEGFDTVDLQDAKALLEELGG